MSENDPSSANLIKHFTDEKPLSLQAAVDYGFLYHSNIHELWKTIVDAGVDAETLHQHMITNTLDVLLKQFFSDYKLRTFSIHERINSPYFHCHPP